jgi:nucleoid-associated protein YgaU
MSAGTKVTIAVVVLFAALLGVYYGFGGPGSGVSGGDLTPPADGQVTDLEAVRQPPSPDPDPVLPDETPGVLSASVEDAIGESSSAAEPGFGVLASDGLAAARPSTAKPPDDQWVLGPPPAYPPAEPAPGPDPKFVDYSVREGDSMWSIADHWLGDANQWGLIADVNPTIDPDRLRVGQRIRIPTEPKAAGPMLNAPARLPATETGAASYYTVRSGDTLSRIAQLKYRDAAKWKAIYDANRGTIGFDPDRLEVGMRLRIPPA